MTRIEWTEETWNPIVGCSVVSPGCTNCYAMRMAARLEAMGTAPHYRGTTQPSRASAVWTGKVALAPDAVLTKPLHWMKPRTVFVNSMGDLFHEAVPDEWIDMVFAVMAMAPQHTFQVLTKRAERMRDYVRSRRVLQGNIGGAAEAIMLKVTSEVEGNVSTTYPRTAALEREIAISRLFDGLPNVWLGVSAEDQARADERIPLLLDTPAALRFVSAEPLLGPIDLIKIKAPANGDPARRFTYWDALRGSSTIDHPVFGGGGLAPAKLDWVIAGGESGPGARPMHPDWARSLRDQCAAAGVPFFFKQWGEWAPSVGAVDWWVIDDDPEISRFDHREWNDGRWSEVFRPIWCDFQDGNYDQTQTVSRIGKRRAGRLLDGVEHNGMPEAHHG